MYGKVKIGRMKNKPCNALKLNTEFMMNKYFF